MTVCEWDRATGTGPIAGERLLCDSALIGRIYYNLGLEYANRDRYELSIAATHRSYELDPTHLAARNNLLATLNNWSLLLAQRGDIPAALDATRRGLQLDPHYAPLRENLRRLERMAADSPSTWSSPARTFRASFDSGTVAN
jgi:tetratricopeptide (TPR) repeat protein